MNRINFVIIIGLVITSCNHEPIISSISLVNWDKRTINFKLNDSLEIGSSYLSIYSQIYSQTEHLTHNLTATVSIRNISSSDSIYLFKADYFDTKGHLIRSYFNKPIFISPLETVEIVIDEKDKEGGTGANFVFDWKINKNSPQPFFEGVMISTSGQQGLSFTTQGKKIE
jgi:hypothetical protein